MEALTDTTSDFYFLSGGGEMGALIRSMDWSKTPLGHPSLWPSSLRKMVSVMVVFNAILPVRQFQ